MKICKCCLVEKKKKEFSKDDSQEDGLNRYCRVCATRKLRQSDQVDRMIQDFVLGKPFAKCNPE